MKDRIADLALAVSLIVLGSFVLVDINTTEMTGHSVIGSIGFSTLPTIYAGLIVVFAAVIGVVALAGMWRERALQRPSPSPEDTAGPGKSGPSQKLVAIRTLGTIAVVGVYASLLKHVGFFVLTAVFLFIMFQLYGQRSLVQTTIVALIGAAAMHGLFITALKLPL